MPEIILFVMKFLILIGTEEMLTYNQQLVSTV